MGATSACEDCKAPGSHPERWWKWDGDPAPYKLRLCQACLLKREEYVAGEPERQRIRAARDKARAPRASRRLPGKCSHASLPPRSPTQQPAAPATTQSEGNLPSQDVINPCPKGSVDE